MSVEDHAQDVEMRDRELAIAAQRRRATDVQPLPTVCDNGCGEKPLERSRYCSTDCRESCEQRERMKRISGNK